MGAYEESLRYQGWGNWHTWEAKLLLDNEEQMANHTIPGFVRLALDVARGPKDSTERRIEVLASLLRSNVWAYIRARDRRVTSYLVRWDEIAAAYLDAREEDEEYKRERQATKGPGGVAR